MTYLSVTLSYSKERLDLPRGLPSLPLPVGLFLSGAKPGLMKSAIVTGILPSAMRLSKTVATRQLPLGPM